MQIYHRKIIGCMWPPLSPCNVLPVCNWQGPRGSSVLGQCVRRGKVPAPAGCKPAARWGTPKIIAALLLALLLSPGFSRAAETSVFKPDRVLTYKTAGDVTLKLHVFEPAGLKTNEQRPAIVLFFGGGWNSGDARQFYQQARALADQGMVAFSADYRVKSRNQTTPFECVKDAKSAIRWVRAHAAELGVDPNRIVASGGSAGGHLAACTGVIAGSEEAGENLKISSRPNAMILFNPVVDTTEKGFGAALFKPEQQTELSPCHQVRKGIAPTIVFHGTADKTVPFENAERFAKLMKETGNDCVLVPFEGKGHGFFNGTFFRPKGDGADYDLTMKRSVEFLTAHGFLPVTK